MIKMSDILMQIGILSAVIGAVIFFGFKIGIAMGFAGISKKVAALIAIAYGAGILLLTKLVSGYSDVLNKVVYEYNFFIFLAMAIILIYAGLHTIRDWKIHQKNHAKATCLAMLAPCPCCFGAVIAEIILMSPLIGVSAFYAGQYAAVILSMTIGICYFLSDLIVKAIKKPYPVLLGNFMMFFGLYFLVSALVIPNINSVLTSKISPLTILSVTDIVYVLIGVFILVVLGVYITKKRSPLI